MTETATSAPPPSTGSDPRARSSSRAALVVFVVLVVGAAPLVLVDLGRSRWFILDEWDFLTHRRVGDVSGLFAPHNEHWSTLPILAYRAMFALVGLHHYWPYQAMVVALHLVAVVLLRVVMRRAGVGSWTATVVAALLILFGAGQENIVWAFQIGFVGSLVFGLVQLILTDHDGEWGRRDWLGLVAGAAALMCSGVGVAMVVVVGISVWCRRGWRAAGGQVLPLMVLYLAWWASEQRPGSTTPPHVGLLSIVGHVVRWDLSGVWGAFEALGQSSIVAAALIVVLVLGLGLSWRPRGRSAVRGAGAPVLGLLCGALVLLTITGWGRWYYPGDSSDASRYVYLVVAMLLPAFGLAVDAIGRRWRFALPVALVLMVLGVPGNVGEFGNGRFVGPAFDAHQQLLEAIADSPLARHTPPVVIPSPRNDGLLTVGWLVAAKAAGKLSSPGRVPPAVAAEVPVALGLTEGAIRAPALTHCQKALAVALNPQPGTFVRISRGLVRIAGYDRALGIWSDPLWFNTDAFFGPVFTVRNSGLHLRIRSGVHGQEVTVCD
jgi:hypothetical protein